jgi:hypothetical protein
MGMADLTANRECGECNVCCKVLGIDPLKKVPGVLCPNRTKDQGCAIYETRPTVCRKFYCGWRILPLGEEWRPDKSEILIVPTGRVEPIRPEDGLQFELIGALDKVFWKPLVNMIASLIQKNVPVYLSVTAQVGYLANRAYLNDSRPLKQAIAKGDLSLMTSLLSDAVQACIVHPNKKLEYDDESPN